MTYHRSVLPNGLRLLLAPMDGAKSVTALIMVGAGSRYEARANNGVSHFLEHMAFKGTKKRPSALVISTLIDGIGGEFNAFTSKESTGYYIKSSSNHINLSLDVLSDMLQNSLFDEKEIDKERGVILEEINLYEDTPVRKIGDVYERLLYGDTPMGWDVGGEKEVIKKITRPDFITYMGSLYSPHNLVVVVAGGFSEKKVKDLVGRYFGSMRRFKTIAAKKIVEKQSMPAVYIKHKKTEQVHLAIGVRTINAIHKHRYPLSLLSAILGGGMSSRLFSEVREKRGLAYYVRTGSELYQDCGTLVSMAGVDSKRVDEAIKVIIDEYEVIANPKGKISDEELKKAKEFLKGHLVLELEDSRAVAGFYGGQELLEKTIDKPVDVLAKIDGVTVEEVRSVAQKYLVRDTLNLAIIGDFEDKSRFEKLLAL